MSNLLSIAISGLNAAKAGLNTTSNNLANVGTTGYSRETVQQTESLVQTQANGYAMGSGVTVNGVIRSSSQFLTQAVWKANSASQSASTYNDLASTLNQALSGSGNLQSSVDSLYAGFTHVANAVSDQSVRQATLGDASATANTYNTLAGQLTAQTQGINQQISDTVNSINTVASQIAALNSAITGSTASSASGGSNALLDQRDALVQQLAGDIGVNTQLQADGSLSVYAQSGQALVSGTQAYALGVKANPYDASQNDVSDSQGSDISGQVSGGNLGALLSYRDNVLSTTQNMLGLNAIGLASGINAQQASGIDLNGKQGAAIFSYAAPSVAASSANTGTASVAASISDVSALTTSNYILQRQDGSWHLSTTGGQSISLTTNKDGSLSADGMTFNVSGKAQDGDSFQIKPTANVAASLAVSMTDPTGIAASAGTAGATANSANTGKASVNSLTTSGGNQASVLDTATVSFSTHTETSSGQPVTITDYQVSDGGKVIGSGSYDPNQGISANGWTLKLNGSPANGDSFTVSPNPSHLGDNSNALKLAALGDAKTLNHGNGSVSTGIAGLTSYIGTIGSQAAAAKTTQTTLYSQAQAAQQALSGVSEDEEASNLVMYQQAYQASAQVISAAQSVFSSLLSAIRS